MKKTLEEEIENDHKMMNKLLLDESELVQVYRENKAYSDEVKAITKQREQEKEYIDHYLESYKHMRSRLN